MPTSGSISPDREVFEQCGCDDVNGDGTVIVRYVELYSVDVLTPGAVPLLLGRFEDFDLTQPYAPVNPVPCE
jgi:hypothetical protein